METSIQQEGRHISSTDSILEIVASFFEETGKRINKFLDDGEYDDDAPELLTIQRSTAQHPSKEKPPDKRGALGAPFVPISSSQVVPHEHFEDALPLPKRSMKDFQKIVLADDADYGPDAAADDDDDDDYDDDDNNDDDEYDDDNDGDDNGVAFIVRSRSNVSSFARVRINKPEATTMVDHYTSDEESEFVRLINDTSPILPINNENNRPDVSTIRSLDRGPSVEAARGLAGSTSRDNHTNYDCQRQSATKISNKDNSMPERVIEKTLGPISPPTRLLLGNDKSLSENGEKRASCVSYQLGDSRCNEMEAEEGESVDGDVHKRMSLPTDCATENQSGRIKSSALFNASEHGREKSGMKIAQTTEVSKKKRQARAATLFGPLQGKQSKRAPAETRATDPDNNENKVKAPKLVRKCWRKIERSKNHDGDTCDPTRTRFATGA